MRIRRTNALLGALLVIGLTFMMYLVMDTINLQLDDVELQKLELGSLEGKLKSLENDLLFNQKTIHQIKETVKEIRQEQSQIREQAKTIRSKGQSAVNKTFASIFKADYEFAQNQPNTCDIRMADVYQELTFDNPDGGVWKQGWDIQYDPIGARDPAQKLQVIIMPHSHNDPGWIKTFEKYYLDQTKHIFDNMVPKLLANPKRKFIWAEISYLSMWWPSQTSETRNNFKKLLNNGQLEIVTGGWVMNDEANTHYTAIIEQLITGHEWLKLNLDGYKPNNGWAIDPFGYTPTMAYLLKRIGFDGMLIQRTHYSVKKHFAHSQDLEFMWRQHWDHEDTTDMMTHMMPFYSYDIPHTCGPDPKICCQFDFDRLPGGIAGCPWRIPPKPITDANVAERSRTLLDQYRKKASLYKSNVVLIPLGDDFRYDTAREWDRQFENYEKIIDYINQTPELNAEVQFGTLEDYFSALRDASKAKTGTETGLLKSLSGDFFTYADRDDHYWSGYFTSRPFYKNLDRVLAGWLRSAEILYSIMWAEMEYVGSDVMAVAEPLMENLMIGRQSLALFQHHDGITGTAKNHVVDDYGARMLQSIQGLQEVIAGAAHYLLTPSKSFYKAPDKDSIFFDLDENRASHSSEATPSILQIGSQQEKSKVVIFNSHARRRSEIVSIRVSLPNIRVYKVTNIEGEDEEEPIPCQLSPVFDDQGQILNSEYQLTFLAQVKGLGLHSYYIQQLRQEDGRNTDMDVATIRIHNSAKHPFQVAPFSEVSVLQQGEPFDLQNGYVQAHFDANGILQAWTNLDEKQKSEMKLDFIIYGTRKSGDKSGAYLFLPDGPSKVMKVESPVVRVIQGKILSYVEVFLPFCRHIVALKSSPGEDGTGLQIENHVDIARYNNFEIAMRLSSDIKSGQEFLTDLNGFQMMRRQRMDKIPLQANFYPVASMAYIEDETSRMTLISAQPLGGSSMAPGQIEIMLDRRLMQDDNRGLFQGVTDNHVTPHVFYLLLERKLGNCQDEAKDPQASYPSLLASQMRHTLLNPMKRLLWVGKNHAIDGFSKSYEPLEKDIPCDIHVVNLRTMQKTAIKTEPGDESALIVHRQGFNGCYKPVGMTCSTNGGKISLEELFPELYSSSVNQMSLSLLYDGLKVEKGFTVSIKPMEIYSFLLKR
ncbi:hypothetical protein TCAL_04678 [Tigriopus californicus]|uniref:Alpha-mannosidase n=1 Tax=Tigriopus californicus TaxID=6832 RepID=A0A553NSB6_TIGCA|nr:alpha-mannosidase 2-like [Tigriopus californicus]TRY68325.1 hypothetical protein TCAL_04678 [Tigriopus californicus]|eukprot:TCALIF_04678-PA protein Name:"Similar to Man2a1 Alpha-mannosidase 2 (Mus musculus)" AED:0.10 eAED:0.10 QI:197/1/1/1/0.91/1/13/93/1155